MANAKTYLVQFTYERPYPFKRDYRIEAGNMGTATARAFRQLRKAEKVKRINELAIKISYLGTNPTLTTND